jgi:hypothetical protein
MKTDEQAVKIRTKLKFKKSQQTGTYIGFVSKDFKSKKLLGVRQESELPKKIVLVDKKLANTVIENLLYDAAIIPMKEKDGYIAVRICPVAFQATLETIYVPKTIYRIEIKFGGKTIIFDPVDGDRNSIRTVSGVREILEKRMDIANLQQVVDEFNEAASNLMKQYEKDKMQFILRKRQIHESKASQETKKSSYQSPR